VIRLDLDKHQASMVATACLAVSGEGDTPDDVAAALRGIVDDLLDQLERLGDD
jgi:hypothetical protein